MVLWYEEEDDEVESSFNVATIHPISRPLPRSLKGIWNDFEHTTGNRPSENNYNTIVAHPSTNPPVQTHTFSPSPPSPLPTTTRTAHPSTPNSFRPPRPHPSTLTHSPQPPHSSPLPSTKFSINLLSVEESAGRKSRCT